ncbi:MAG: type IV toxin-antitoxin system AbiEi family antitoxin domain-containing protein [Nitrospira sp.]
MKKNLGRYERQLLAYAQLRGKNTIRTGEMSKSLRLSPKQERELLSRLTRAGMIARVSRGLYLVPQRLPLGGKWSPSEVLAIDTLIKDRGGSYQICGPNAFHRYGFDEQIPNRTYVYNNRISGERKVGPIALSLIKVANKRLGSTEEIHTEENINLVYASRVRTLVDAVYDWSRFNSLPRAYDWIRRELKMKRVSPGDLVNITLQYGDTGTIRRMGVILEKEGVGALLLSRLNSALKPTTSLISWIPSRPKRGIVNRRWGVLINETA